MRSGTSFFNWTVFKKTVMRFWPLWGAYFAIWLVMLPLNGLMMLRMESYSLSGFGYMEDFAFSRVPVTAAVESIVVLTVVFAALAAMAVFSHLYNARSANLFGSLPIRREGLFVTYYLAGLAFLMVPNAVIFLLTLLVELAGGTVCWQGLLFWLGVVCGEGFFFYSMAVLCGLFTGHILALPAFYVIFNFIVFAVTELVHMVLQAFYYGFSGFTEEVYDVVKWFTPIVRMAESLQVRSYHTNAEVTGVALPVLETEGLGAVGIYAIVAVVLTVCAFLLYRARRLESAGDVVSVRPMKPVFKYGVALCAGLALGMVTTVFTGGGELMLMIAIAVWGVMGYFAAQMLLDKSFKVFHKWKGAAVVAAVFIVLFCVVGFDITGFETRVPDPAQVDSVYINGINAVYLMDDGDHIGEVITDPEVIKLATILHQKAVEQRDKQVWQTQSGGVSTSLTLSYTLKGGGTMNRRYTVWLDSGEISQEGTAAWAVQQLYDNRELYWQAYGFKQMEECLAQGYRLERAEYADYDEETGYGTQGAFYGQDAGALLAAVKEDFFAGRIAVRRVDDEERWYGGSPEESLTFAAMGPEDSEGYRGDCYVQITLQDTASSTLAALDEMADRAVTSGIEGYRW